MITLTRLRYRKGASVMKSFLRRWGGRILITASLLLLAFGIFFLVYIIRAKYASNNYILRLGASFNAASLVNGAETFTEPEKAVITEYNGSRYVVLPENYKALNMLLRKDCASPLFPGSFADAPLTISICSDTLLRIRPDRGSVDGAVVSFETEGHRYVMHIRGGNIWTQLLTYATEGDRRNPNILLPDV